LQANPVWSASRAPVPPPPARRSSGLGEHPKAGAEAITGADALQLHRVGHLVRGAGAADHGGEDAHGLVFGAGEFRGFVQVPGGPDRESTRLNSSHVKISYAVFRLEEQ